MSNYTIPTLPLSADVETKKVLKKLVSANKALAELNGVSDTIPNQEIIINTLSLQEAKDSSAIENIITTHDELFSSDSFTKSFTSNAAKEVYKYVDALKYGFELVTKHDLLTSNNIINIQAILEETKSGFRKLPGTELMNDKTKEVIYTPPQRTDEIVKYMNNLECFINDETQTDLDVLTRMAIIHHQFESIHPFYDGNGRTGRIINILYLVKEKSLNLPILYLSRYINQNKNEYYMLLQKTRDTDEWEEWILFILDAVEKTSIQTISIIKSIKEIMQLYKEKIRTNLRNVYSQDLINNIFKHPYTKIDFVVNDLRVSRQTASRYLDQLCDLDLVHRLKIGKENFYINKALYKFLNQATQVHKLEESSDSL